MIGNALKSQSCKHAQKHIEDPIEGFSQDIYRSRLQDASGAIIQRNGPCMEQEHADKEGNHPQEICANAEISDQQDATSVHHNVKFNEDGTLTDNSGPSSIDSHGQAFGALEEKLPLLAAGSTAGFAAPDPTNTPHVCQTSTACGDEQHKESDAACIFDEDGPENLDHLLPAEETWMKRHDATHELWQLIRTELVRREAAEVRVLRFPASAIVRLMKLSPAVVYKSSEATDVINFASVILLQAVSRRLARIAAGRRVAFSDVQQVCELGRELRFMHPLTCNLDQTAMLIRNHCATPMFTMPPALPSTEIGKSRHPISNDQGQRQLKFQGSRQPLKDLQVENVASKHPHGPSKTKKQLKNVLHNRVENVEPVPSLKRQGSGTPLNRAPPTKAPRRKAGTSKKDTGTTVATGSASIQSFFGSFKTGV